MSARLLLEPHGWDRHGAEQTHTGGSHMVLSALDLEEGRGEASSEDSQKALGLASL